MARKQFHSQAHYYLASICALSLPFGRFTAVFIGLLLLNWLIEGDFKNKFQELVKNKLALLFIGFFLMHVVGLAYTQNMNSGIFDLQVKLSLFVFPFIVATRPYSHLQVRNIFSFFIIGCFLSSLFLLSVATYDYIVLSESNFFYQEFSFLIHPSYLSMYFNLAITWLLYNTIQKNQSANRLTFVVSILLVLFFSFIIVLLSSKMGLLTLLLLFIGFAMYFTISRKKYVLGFVVILLIFATTFSLFRYVPEIRDRLNNAIASITSSTSKQTDAESTAVRMLIWSAANQVISENFVFGVGTGDAKDKLIEEYEKRGMTGALEHKLNAHNEFYQVFVSLGLIGFVLLLMTLLLPLYSAFTSSNWIYILFLLIIILSFIPESMFETQAGVLFYGFFNSLLCFRTTNNTIAKN